LALTYHRHQQHFPDEIKLIFSPNHTQVIHLRQVQRNDWTLHQLQRQFSSITVIPAFSSSTSRQGSGSKRSSSKHSTQATTHFTRRSQKSVIACWNNRRSTTSSNLGNHAGQPHAFRHQWSALAQETLMHEIMAAHSNSRLLLMDLTSAFKMVYWTSCL
jgi:hypothetical protein